MIDTLSYTKDLMKAGLSEEQAELMVRSQFSMISTNVATKADLLEIRNELTMVENRITTRLGSLIIIMFGALAALQTFLRYGLSS